MISSFFDSMPPSDLFGLRHIGKYRHNDIILEAKGKNTSTKRALLDEMLDMAK